MSFPLTLLHREGQDFSKMLVIKPMVPRRRRQIDWDRTWKLAKMAFQTVMNIQEVNV